jgi:hypothetical protein
VALVTAKKKKVEILVAPDGKILKTTVEKAKAAPGGGTSSLDRIPAQVVVDTVGGRAKSELHASFAIVRCPPRA